MMHDQTKIKFGSTVLRPTVTVYTTCGSAKNSCVLPTQFYLTCLLWSSH